MAEESAKVVSEIHIACEIPEADIEIFQKAMQNDTKITLQAQLNVHEVKIRQEFGRRLFVLKMSDPGGLTLLSVE